MLEKYKRKLKSKFVERKEDDLTFYLHKAQSLTIIVFIIFLFVQLVSNAYLTPRGARLEALNREKNILIETNREISQEVARIKSMSIIKEITEEEINLRPIAQTQIIYISNESVIAEL